MLELNEVKRSVFNQDAADDGIITSSLDDIQLRCDAVDAALGYGQVPFRHGDWEFDPSVLVLRHLRTGYEIDLETATTAASLLDKILQVGAKRNGGMRVDQAITLLKEVASLRGVGSLQGAFCPYGRPSRRRVNWGKPSTI